MRVSQAGLACVRRVGPDGPEFLTQWSKKWGMYSLVGGHVEPGETFRECCVREVAEELHLTPGTDYSVSEAPLAPTVEYVAMSGGSNVETQYRMELFAVELLTPEAWATVDANPANRWLTAAEILAERTADDRPISAQVRTNFLRNGVL